MEGDGEADLLGKLGQFPNLRNEAGGRDGDATGADVEAPVGGDHVKSLAEVGEVGEGFAHAHEDEVVDLFAREFFGEDDLGDDLGGGEVAGEAIEPGGAEFTSVGAADLGRDAEGVAVGCFAIKGGRGRDEDGLDIALVGEFEEELTGGVGRALGQGMSEGAEGVFFGESRAEGGGEVAHFFPGAGALFVDPIEDLGGAVGGLVLLFEEFRELGACEHVSGL